MSNKKPATQIFPVLPVRDVVIMPHTPHTLAVGRPSSIEAIKYVMQNGGRILVIKQINPDQDEPSAGNLEETGTICRITQFLKRPDGSYALEVKGEERAVVASYREGPFLQAEAETAVGARPSKELDALGDMLKGDFYEILQLSNKTQILERLRPIIEPIQNPSQLADVIAYYLLANNSERLGELQKVLDLADPAERISYIADLIAGMKENLETDQRVNKRIKDKFDKNQREFYIREQIGALKKELGEDDDEDELEELQARIDEASLPDKIHAKAEKELKKLSGMNPQAAEATVVRNYLNALLDYPWGQSSEVTYDLGNARTVLDADHYGLEKVKEQVIENLAVQKRLVEKGVANEGEADILCLVGPPGVGKTSICKSLAKATGREYVRMAVGGVRDEAEIRGHRRTYIGAKPGKIVEKMMEAKSENPLFVIDEIDKMSSDAHRGDPASAMLEVLDPEQNGAFEDHYLEVPIDLSKVKFVCTANVWGNIPGPLRDRMETVFLGSYTEDEKLEIARQHLVRKQMKANGLDESEFSVSDDALRALVRHYTKESGVRTLQREIKKICRKAVVALEGESGKIEVTSDNLEKYAGKKLYDYDLIGDADHEVGVVNGLAYTSVGGETLKIEAVKMPKGRGIVTQSGKLGDVMKESITAATVLLKSKADKFGIDLEKDFKEFDFHVHVPEGAVPKDGPSAGVGMLTALFSEVTGKPVRKDVAMTGEITTKGKVTAIGGVREKLSAAARAGYTTVLIPKSNEKDLDEVPPQVLSVLKVIPVSTVEEVLQNAIVGGYTPREPSNDVMPPSPGNFAAYSQPRPHY